MDCIFYDFSKKPAASHWLQSNSAKTKTYHRPCYNPPKSLSGNREPTTEKNAKEDSLKPLLFIISHLTMISIRYYIISTNPSCQLNKFVGFK